MARKKAVQSRVRWNDQEKQSLIEAGRAMLTQDPGARLLAVVHGAQKVLSEDRRRKILQIGQVPWFKAGLRGIGVPTASKRGRPPATPAAPGTPPAAPASSGIAIEQLAAGLKDAIVDALVGVIATAIHRVGLVPTSSGKSATGKRRGRPPKKKAAAKSAKA